MKVSDLLKKEVYVENFKVGKIEDIHIDDEVDYKLLGRACSLLRPIQIFEYHFTETEFNLLICEQDENLRQLI
jgi:hypothetical protein